MGTPTIFHLIIYIYMYIYAFYDSLVSHNMHSLCNLKVKYSFILSKLIKKFFTYELSGASHRHDVSNKYITSCDTLNIKNG